eukprot:1028659-Rhodomonas_salina.1
MSALLHRLRASKKHIHMTMGPLLHEHGIRPFFHSPCPGFRLGWPLSCSSSYEPTDCGEPLGGVRLVTGRDDLPALHGQLWALAKVELNSMMLCVLAVYGTGVAYAAMLCPSLSQRLLRRCGQYRPSACCYTKYTADLGCALGPGVDFHGAQGGVAGSRLHPRARLPPHPSQRGPLSA